MSSDGMCCGVKGAVGRKRARLLAWAVKLYVPANSRGVGNTRHPQLVQG